MHKYVVDEHHHAHSIKKTTLLAMAIFSVGYMLSESNLDGFNIEEAVEYILNKNLESAPVHMAGFITSFISNIPLLAAIIYCWARNHSHTEYHHDENHQHATSEVLFEFSVIGLPFALMGSAAYLDSMGELLNIKNLSGFEQVLAYSGAAVSGIITAFGAYKLHGFHVHDAMEENGGGAKGFLRGIYTTFVRNVWSAKDEHETKGKKIWAVFNEIWKKYGIVAVHGFLGNFAANVFLEETGLAKKSASFDLVLKIFLPIAVMLYEGNTEARSLDAYKQKQHEPVSYSLYSKLVVIFSGMLHTIPAITSLAVMMGSSESGPFDGALYNTLVYMAATSLLAYPSVYGFFATTLPGFNEATVNLKAKWLNFSHSGYRELEEEKPSSCVSLLSKIGFLGIKKPEPKIPRHLLFADENGNNLELGRHSYQTV